MINKSILVLLLLFTSLMISCTSNSDTAGSGHSGETFVAGIIVNKNHQPMRGLPLTILPSTTLLTNTFTDSLTTISTDSTGAFTFWVTKGTYTISSNGDSSSLVYIPNITLTDSAVTLTPHTTTPPKVVIVDSVWAQKDSAVMLVLAGTVFSYSIRTDSLTLTTFPQEDLTLTKVTSDTTYTFELLENDTILQSDSLLQGDSIP